MRVKVTGIIVTICIAILACSKTFVKTPFQKITCGTNTVVWI